MGRNKRIGVMTGGGDCPGLNAAIRAVAKKAIRENYEVVGIKNGWKGFIENDYEILDGIRASGIIDRGGTILGTSRLSPFYVEKGTEKVFTAFEQLGLEGLVVLGGQGTLSATNRLFKMGLPAVGIPKTIDNDVKETDYTIGFQTAVQIATDALDRLRSVAESFHRVMLLEVMGRHTGWIATYAGMANGADAILIPEIPLDDNRLEALCQMLQKRSKEGKKFSVLVVAEGTTMHGELVSERGFTVSLGERKARLGGVGQILCEIIEKKTGLETRVSSLDYIQRGGIPVAYDRSLATVFGVKAVELVQRKKFGEMTALKGNRFTSVTLDKATDGIKSVNLKVYAIAEVFFT